MEVPDAFDPQVREPWSVHPQSHADVRRYTCLTPEVRHGLPACDLSLDLDPHIRGLAGEQGGIDHIRHSGHVVIADAIRMTQQTASSVTGLETGCEPLQELGGRRAYLPNALLLRGRELHLVADIQANLY
jgi:hypothetical protein